MLGKMGILNNISLNIQRKNNNDKILNEINKNTINNCTTRDFIEGVGSNEREENFSVSTRSSQTELSDVVRLTGTLHESAQDNINRNLNSNGSVQISLIKGNHGSNIIESKPTVALYIGDLEKNVTEEMLKSFLNGYKSLISVKICVDSNTGKSMGYGYLNFSKKEEANEVMERFNYTTVFGKEIRIMPSLRNSFLRKKIGTNVFFANLPLVEEQITTRCFYDFFKKYGSILSCKLNIDKKIGFIFFENEKSANDVINDYNEKKLFFGSKIKCGIHLDKEFRKISTSNNDYSSDKTKKINISNEKAKNNSIELRSKGNQNNQLYQVYGYFKYSILVKNLPKGTTNDEIVKLFEKFAKVISIENTSNINETLGRDTKDVTIILARNTDIKLVLFNLKGLKVNGNLITAVELNARKNLTYMDHKKLPTLFLSNLSTVCNKEFLTQMCIQESIRVDTINITSYQNDPLTFSGFIKCKTKYDSRKLNHFLNNRLIGESVVKTSWKKSSDGIPIEYFKNEVSRNVVNKNGIIPKSIYNSTREYRTIQSHQNIQGIPKYSNGLDHSHSSSQTQIQYNMPYNIPTFSIYPNVNKWQVLEALRRQVKKGIDFLKYPSATRDSNLTCITEYIFEIYWGKDITRLNNFLLLTHSNTHNEGVLQKQIEDAANFLGFGR